MSLVEVAMTNIEKIGPVRGELAGFPENVYAVKVSDLREYGATPEDAVRAYMTEQGAVYVCAWAFRGEDFAFLQFPR